MLEGEKDELVPREHGDEIEKLCKNDGEAPRPKELVAGHHTTPEVISCAPKLSATHLGPLKLISCSSLARQCRDQRSATQSSSVESLLPGGGSVTTVAGLGGLSFKRVKVEGALHTQVLAKGSGRIAAADALRGGGDVAV